MMTAAARASRIATPSSLLDGSAERCHASSNHQHHQDLVKSDSTNQPVWNESDCPAEHEQQRAERE